MSSPENLTQLLWDQAVANEDWEEVKRLELFRQQAEVSPSSSGVEEQRAILDAENYWNIGKTATHHIDSLGQRDIM